MIVSNEDAYDRLKYYTWTFRGAEYDLYSTVDIDAQDRLTLQIGKTTFTLENLIINGSSAKISASCEQDETVMQFTFTGTEK